MESENLGKKWNYLKKILERSGPFDTEIFMPSSDSLEFLHTTCKILVIGKFIISQSCNQNWKFVMTSHNFFRCWRIRL